MARTKISEFSATPGDNTDIDGIDIAEGCAPSGINNAIRELMAQLKDMQTGASGDTFTLTTVNSTTVDTTNLEATNLKAKDGTAAGSIADSTGVVTLGSSVLTTTDINGGTVDGTTIGATTPSTVVATQVDITAQGDLRLQDTTGGQYVALQAPSTIASSYTLTLPVDDGTAGQALITDGSGVLSWSSAASGDVYGPASATDNAVARYDGTTGKIIQNSAVTIGDDGATVIAANSTTDGLRITQIGAGNALLVEDSANPDATPFVVQNDGRTLLGSTTSYSGVFNAAFFQAHAVGGNGAIDGFRYSADAFGVDLGFLKSRSATTGTQTIVQSGDALGVLRFAGSDGTAFKQAATIEAAVDGTPGTNDMPGRLVFSTTADGASSPTERMRIGNSGGVGIGSTSVTDRNLAIGKNITGATAAYGVVNNGQIQSDVTNLSQYYRTTASTAAAAFTLTTLDHFSANQGTIGAGSAVTSQVGFNATASLTGATNNYGFYGNIASGTGRWNFYAAGTAANVFAGTTSIGGLVGAESLRVTPVASAVNYLHVFGATTGTAVVVGPKGSDTNIPLWFQSQGTGEFRFGTGGSANFYSQFAIANTTSAVNYVQVTGATAADPTVSIRANGSSTNVGMDFFTKGSGKLAFRTDRDGTAPTQFLVAHKASAVNYIQVAGNVTGSFPYFSAQGSDSNIPVGYYSKGTGAHYFQTGGGLQLVVANTASAVNYLQVTGGVTGNAATLSAQGSDTNIDITLTPKGTGNVRFGTLTATSDVAITGYIEVKDSAGNVRKLAVIT